MSQSFPRTAELKRGMDIRGEHQIEFFSILARFILHQHSTIIQEEAHEQLPIASIDKNAMQP